MTLKTQMLADQAVFFNTSEFAFAATYTVAETSVSSSINVIFVPGEDLTQFTGGKSAVSLMAVKKSDVPHPAVYDTVTIGAVEYRVEAIDSGNNYMWNLTVTSDLRPYPQGATT